MASHTILPALNLHFRLTQSRKRWMKLKNTEIVYFLFKDFKISSNSPTLLSQSLLQTAKETRSRPLNWHPFPLSHSHSADRKKKNTQTPSDHPLFLLVCVCVIKENFHHMLSPSSFLCGQVFAVKPESRVMGRGEGKEKKRNLHN